MTLPRLRKGNNNNNRDGDHGHGHHRHQQQQQQQQQQQHRYEEDENGLKGGGGDGSGGGGGEDDDFYDGFGDGFGKGRGGMPTGGGVAAQREILVLKGMVCQLRQRLDEDSYTLKTQGAELEQLHAETVPLLHMQVCCGCCCCCCPLTINLLIHDTSSLFEPLLKYRIRVSFFLSARLSFFAHLLLILYL